MEQHSVTADNIVEKYDDPNIHIYFDIDLTMGRRNTLDKGFDAINGQPLYLYNSIKQAKKFFCTARKSASRIKTESDLKSIGIDPIPTVLYTRRRICSGYTSLSKLQCSSNA